MKKVRKQVVWITGGRVFMKERMPSAENRRKLDTWHSQRMQEGQHTGAG